MNRPSMDDKPTGSNIYFNPKEMLALSMGVALILDDIEETKLKPWNPEARKLVAEIKEAAEGCKRKIERFGNVKCELPPYHDGDEDEFTTKES